MSPHLKMFFMINIALGTMMTLGSSHWFLAWLGLELNTLATLPIIAQKHHPRSVEAATKYLLIQATAAALMLFASMNNGWMTGQWFIQETAHPLSIAIVTIALLIKLGAVPFHAWLPEVLQGVDMMTALLITTWQKIAPLYLLIHINPQNSTMLVSFGVVSVVLGGWAGINQTQTRKIIAYSSIVHMGWILVITLFTPNIATLTLLMYMITSTSILLTLKFNKATSINSLASSWSKLPVITSLTPLVLLSLGGLPPLSGFLPKWLILQELTKQSLTPTATLMALSALLSLYFYLRLCYAMTLTMSPNNISGSVPWRLPTAQSTLPLALSTSLAILLLPLTPAAIALASL